MYGSKSLGRKKSATNSARRCSSLKTTKAWPVLRCSAWLCGDENVMVILETSPAPDQGDAGLGEELNVHGIETVHLSSHVVQQLRRINPDL